MATSDRPSARFDSFDLKRARIPEAVPDEASPGASGSISDSERMTIAQGLRDLGFLPAQIEQILEGPTATSVEAVTGRIIGARTMPAIKGSPSGKPQELTSNNDTGASQQSGQGSPIEAPPKKYPGRVSPEQYQLDIDQEFIIDAVWHNLHGDPHMLVRIADNFEELTGPLQAYVSAAVEEGKIFLVDLNQWVKDFDKAQKEQQKNRADDDKKRKESVSSIAGVAASAANLIPVVGQILALAIAASVAISEAILAAFPLPLREGADQVHDEVEGLDAFFGLSNYYAGDTPSDELPSRDARYLAAKQAVIQDPVASLLPVPRRRAMYKFTPHLEGFVRAAHELGLYEGEGNTIASGKGEA